MDKKSVSKKTKFKAAETKRWKAKNSADKEKCSAAKEKNSVTEVENSATKAKVENAKKSEAGQTPREEQEWFLLKFLTKEQIKEIFSKPLRAPEDEEPQGPTGAICRDLPSPYVPHRATGLLHLPRFIAKIRRAIFGRLPKSYQRNFTKGFDGFLCAHLGVSPQEVIGAVRVAGDDDDMLDERLLRLFPKDCQVAKWNRDLVQRGMSEMGREALAEAKEKMGIGHRDDIISFADLIDFDEGRIK